MKIVILCFLFVVAVVCKTLDPKCGENEEFSNCDTPCPGYCEAPERPCVVMCARGCFCKKGYLRASKDPSSKCILPSNCQLPA